MTHRTTSQALRFSLAPAVLLVSGMTSPSHGQELSIDSLLAAHAQEIRIEEGRLVGPAAETIFRAAYHAQFVAILEEHNVGDLADFSSALFTELHRREGFRYMALELGSVIIDWLMAPRFRGDVPAASELLARFPHALTFATDEEIEMIMSVARESSGRHAPLWGIDQEFGALHILSRLEELATSQEAREEAIRLRNLAARYESTRSGDTLFLSQVAMPSHFERLPELFGGAGEEARTLVEALRRTNRIYHNWYRSAVLDEPTGYESGRERELSMKLRFMEQYRRAEVADGGMPRVLAKLGHWHLFRGIYRADIPTFGNFLSELAISNGMDAFLISTYVIESPDSWRGTGGPLARAALQGTFTLIDLRPLRSLAHAGRIADLSGNLENLIHRADAALIIRGGRTGSYSITRGGS